MFEVFHSLIQRLKSANGTKASRETLHGDGAVAHLYIPQKIIPFLSKFVWNLNRKAVAKTCCSTLLIWAVNFLCRRQLASPYGFLDPRECSSAILWHGLSVEHCWVRRKQLDSCIDWAEQFCIQSLLIFHIIDRSLRKRYEVSRSNRTSL